MTHCLRHIPFANANDSRPANYLPSTAMLDRATNVILPEADILDICGVWPCLGQLPLPENIREASPRAQAKYMALDIYQARALYAFMARLELYGVSLMRKRPQPLARRREPVWELVTTTSSDQQPIAAMWAFHVESWPRLWYDMHNSGSLQYWSVYPGLVDIMLPNWSIPGRQRVWMLKSRYNHSENMPLVIYDPTKVCFILSSRHLRTYCAVVEWCVASGTRFDMPAPTQPLPAGVSVLDKRMHVKRILDLRSSNCVGFLDPGYRISPEDARTWSHKAARILSNSRVAKVALQRGDVIWRWAAEFVDMDLVFADVSMDARIYGVGTCYVWKGMECWGDSMAPEEEATLLGLFYERQHANMDVQGSSKLRSMLPRPHSWEDTSYHTGTWSPQAEEWFQRVLGKYRVSKPTTGPSNTQVSVGQPRKGAEWRKALTDTVRGSRHVWWAARHQARMFLESMAKAVNLD